ncbi:hypothetical protein FNV43_RR06069 [Rhamnella rubrinervis]|uniref:Rad21/Rec8-like protein N-terminal domain-containing protein n=1 Tax=Rhamnella rubrinervis TaxID=2594499 RepID=A0A8K0MLM2_9ROSA|nr:hypothetical protein FNV43_RR06069 [Rhamnella rubrinervis]
MFYSQTFLARKGPLGTVWCAAHLQHRLKKSHYTSTDIPSTVDRIMFPEVPIALRMSGHLLLGVVRIYSKKVEYLCQDCIFVYTTFRKTFSSIDLSEDANQAPVHAITLPDTFDLDALDLDDDISLEGPYDNHLRSYEDITLKEPYVAISFDEDIIMDESNPEEVPDSNVAAMDEDIVHPPAVYSSLGVEVPHDVSFQGPGLSDHEEKSESGHRDENLPDEIEVLREAVPVISPGKLPPVSPNCRNDVTEAHESIDVAMNEKDILSPIMEDKTPGGLSLHQPSSGPPPASVASLQDGLEIINSPISFAIRSTPPVKQPKPRPRKRKQNYDDSPVLTNKFMKKALKDSRDLLRKRRNITCTALGMWKLNNALSKELVLFQPSITEEASPDSVVVRSPAPITEACLDPGVAQSSAPATEEISPERQHEESEPLLNDYDQEIEHLRHVEDHDERNNLPEFIPSSRFTPPLGNDDLTPLTSQHLGSASVERTLGTEVLPTPNLPASTGLYESEFETPIAFFQKQLGVENTSLSDVPEMMHSEDVGDLYFLEADNNTPTGSQGTQGVDSLSVRTRAVAQYLKRQSDVTPSSDDLFGDLSLNKILEGKTRKLCARMFLKLW